MGYPTPGFFQPKAFKITNFCIFEEYSPGHDIVCTQEPISNSDWEKILPPSNPRRTLSQAHLSEVQGLCFLMVWKPIFKQLNLRIQMDSLIVFWDFHSDSAPPKRVLGGRNWQGSSVLRHLPIRVGGLLGHNLSNGAPHAPLKKCEQIRTYPWGNGRRHPWLIW